MPVKHALANLFVGESCFDTLTSLRLGGDGGGGVGSALVGSALVAYAPALRNLALGDYAPLRGGLAMRSLLIDEPVRRAEMVRSLAALDPAHLARLGLTLEDDDAIAALSDTFAASRFTALRELSLSTWTPPRDPPARVPWGRNSGTHLESLSLEALWRESGWDVNVTSLLRQISARPRLASFRYFDSDGRAIEIDASVAAEIDARRRRRIVTMTLRDRCALLTYAWRH